MFKAGEVAREVAAAAEGLDDCWNSFGTFNEAWKTLAR
jgi:hypothetical protein